MIYYGDSQTYGDDSLQLFESAGREDSFKKSIISLDKVSIDHNYNVLSVIYLFFQTYGDDSLQLFERIGREIEQHIQQLQIMFPGSNPLVTQLHALLETLIVVRNSREPVSMVTASSLVQKVI